MGYFNEYINKKYSPQQCLDELHLLIKKYNEITNRYIYLYVAALFKNIPLITMNQEDFYVFRDMLGSVKIKDVDIYIETPGGSGETAEEIGRFLHKKFENINFIISGEAKSAGTILAMAGNKIYMTETGSLGPIDAQMRFGRAQISAYDYKKWIETKMEEANNNGKLNPVDATIISQITPGELELVYNNLEYAKDLVKQWLPIYKFKNWNETNTNHNIVTKEMKEKKAEEIAALLADHSRWRTHGRSLKIDDLSQIGLQIEKLDDDSSIAEIIYRIQFLCKLIFENTSIYKLFISDDEQIFKEATNANINRQQLINAIEKPQIIQIDTKCPHCGKNHLFYKKLVNDNNIDINMNNMHIKELPQENSIKCECGHIIDLQAIKNEIAIKLKK